MSKFTLASQRNPDFESFMDSELQSKIDYLEIQRKKCLMMVQAIVKWMRLIGSFS